MTRGAFDTEQQAMSEPQILRLPYRAEIDGLRAFAVMSVVLYHFGFPLQGGFVGVDIFFVISGFLIGGMLWREYSARGTVHLAQFFARRSRRLAPAFFTMLAVSVGLGWLLLLPFEFEELGKGAIASAVYMSSVLFARQTGYFETSVDERVLLHTWSLSVEEQFYLFMPLLIVLLARRPWFLLWMLMALWVGSLAATVWFTPRMHGPVFFLFPFRLWELLTGMLLAIWSYERGLSLRGYAALSGLGFVILLLSVALIPAGVYFPGVLVIAPVVGTALVLANGGADHVVNRVLRHPVSVAVGAMSYSIYLWHWPVMIFSEYYRGGYANLFEGACWMVLSLGVAWVSWRFVETPLRRVVWIRPPVVLGVVIAASVGVVALGSYIYRAEGVPGRFDAQVQPHIVASHDIFGDQSRCYIAQALPLDGLEVCPIGPDAPPQVLIWGDDHLQGLSLGLEQAAQQAGVPAIVLRHPGCPPLVDLRKVEATATQAHDLSCTLTNQQIKQSFGHLPSLRAVLLVGRWGYYASGQGDGLDHDRQIQLYPTQVLRQANEVQAQVLGRAARETVRHLKSWGLHVAVLRQPPELPYYDSRRAAREMVHGDHFFGMGRVIRDREPLGALAPRMRLADAPWIDMARGGDIVWLDPWPELCDTEICAAIQGGVGRYFDNHHLTLSGGWALGPLFLSLFSAVGDLTQ